MLGRVLRGVEAGLDGREGCLDAIDVCLFVCLSGNPLRMSTPATRLSTASTHPGTAHPALGAHFTHTVCMLLVSARLADLQALARDAYRDTKLVDKTSERTHTT